MTRPCLLCRFCLQVLLSTSFGLLGFFMMPMLPVTLETAVECTYPVPEENSCGLLMTAGNIFGVGFIFAAQYLISLKPIYSPHDSFMTPVAWLLVGVFLVCVVGVITFKGKYLRLQAEAGDFEGEDSQFRMNAAVDSSTDSHNGGVYTQLE